MTTLTADAIPGYTAGTWTLDPTHSEITFSVRHLAISKVRGRFERFDATVQAGEQPLDSTVTASIDVTSVNTNQEQRDQHLRTSDFFAADQHPTITFTSTALRSLGGADFEIDGELTLRGVTKSVTLKAEFGGITTDSYGQTKAGVSATTRINRTEFGVNWNAALEAGGFTLGDEVTIDFELQFTLAK